MSETSGEPLSAAMSGTMSGGCQCGAVRFRASHLGRPSICHCRMCQKHFGSFFGAFVTATGRIWNGRAPADAVALLRPVPCAASAIAAARR